MIAMPCPPPQHALPTPYRLPVRWIWVVAMQSLLARLAAAIILKPLTILTLPALSALMM